MSRDDTLDILSTLTAIRVREEEAAKIWLRFCDAVSSNYPPPTREEVYVLREPTYRATQLHGEAMQYLGQIILENQRLWASHTEEG